jgi:hypothetical protein
MRFTIVRAGIVPTAISAIKSNFRINQQCLEVALSTKVSNKIAFIIDVYGSMVVFNIQTFKHSKSPTQFQLALRLQSKNGRGQELDSTVDKRVLNIDSECH